MKVRAFLLILLWTALTTADPVIEKMKTNKNLNERRRLLLAEKQKTEREARAECIQDYYPCTCEVSEEPGTLNNIYVQCDQISVQRVQEVFQRVNDPEISGLHFSSDESIVSLPSNFLGNTSVKEYITITSLIGSNNGLVIDPQAFRSSQNYTTEFTISGYHNYGLQTNFSFLDGFNNLEKIHIEYVSYIEAFQSLPPLPSLQSLMVSYCELNEFPDLTPAKLKFLNVSSNKLDNVRANSIVASLVASTSAESLESLDFSVNGLRSIPQVLPSSFPNLQNLDFYNNAISHLPTSSLAFASPVKVLRLSKNALKTIESGAFKGNFTVAQIFMHDNFLQLFEEGVFKEMLQQMVSIQPSFPTGFVKLSDNAFNPSNEFACGCDIAWLIRDNRHLLPAVRYGYCAVNSPYPWILFEDLMPEAFAGCP